MAGAPGSVSLSTKLGAGGRGSGGTGSFGEDPGAVGMRGADAGGAIGIRLTDPT